MEFDRISRTEFEREAAALGIRHGFKDARCLGEYRSFQTTGALYSDTPYDWLLICRGATLDREGYTPPGRPPCRVRHLRLRPPFLQMPLTIRHKTTKGAPQCPPSSP
ncbi:hypothetical protein [Streptomyces sp. NPDC058861]|uniref:hypothetical protein n=1 Tax=Streptomyces sp. NPDC058861 TaxID=3346653 RepID=UPI0036994664